ncbi:MAG TPA: type IV pilus twitching motility protein PilT [Symbiobacteriaceae bacterium]|nr:type IV pilus twitching motility protein PilT [Symbiobacteriaceae bacterium]
MFDIDGLLRKAVEQDASDIHLCEAQPPVIRVHGKLLRQGGLPMTRKEMEEACARLIPPDKRADFDAMHDVDFSYSIPGLGRFRVSAYMQRGTPALALRAIPFRILSLRELGLPEILATLGDKPHGLVLVTGPTGSGKSTTLASLIDGINEQYEKHIVTLEDPIEFLHRHKKSVVNQREIGSDTGSFARGLRAALRQDPNVILVGELRDLETITIALQAAETGHLVLATLHTNDAASTIDRVIDVFPPDQQQQVRVQLAATLQGVVAQRLFPRRDKAGRVVALEILMVTPAVRNLIREGKSHQILSVIQTGGKLGMRTMEHSVKELYDQGMIALEDYQAYSQEKAGQKQQQQLPAQAGFMR